ncbi:MAG: helix-turn-helix domain-containing protein [Myxococcaceae bacterium]
MVAPNNGQAASTPEQLAQLLRGFRASAGLTQAAAATAGGMLPKTVSSLESDPGRASVESLYRLLSALDVELVLRPKRPASRGGTW